MTDRTPDASLSDDDGPADLDVLRSLGLDALGGGAPYGGLDDVRARAARVARRRRWSIGAVAAALVLVIAGIGGGLLVAVGEETAPDVATQPGGDEQLFLLPPEDATSVGWQLGLDAVVAPSVDIPPTEDVDVYRFVFQTLSGGPAVTATLFVGPGAETGDGSGPVVVDGMGATTTIQTADIGPVLVGCRLAGGEPDGAAPVAVGVGATDGGLAFELEASSLSVATESCGPDPDVVARVASVLEGLRIVGEAEWRQYLQDHARTNVLDPMATTVTTATSTTSTTVPSAPPCDERLMWEAARVALDLDPNDPGYEGFGPPFEGGYGVYDAVCIGDWADASVSRPGTQTTDAWDVFRWVDGRWTYAGSAGGPPASWCGYQRLGMPLEVFDRLWPTSNVDEIVDRRPCSEGGAGPDR